MPVLEKVNNFLLGSIVTTLWAFPGVVAGVAGPVFLVILPASIYSCTYENKRDKEELKAYKNLEYTQGRRLFESKLHIAFDTYKLRHNAEPTVKDTLQLLTSEKEKYIAELPKNPKEWTPADKEAVEYATELIRIFVERTGQNIPQPQARCVTPCDLPTKLAMIHNRNNVKQLGM